MINLEDLKREVADKYGRTDYAHNNGWRYVIKWTIDYLASRGYINTCGHELIDIRNEVIQSGYMCVKCNAIFAAADHNQKERNNA